MSVTTIMKTVIGAGILSLPLTVSRLGYVLALIIFGVVMGLTQFSCILLLKSKNLSKHSNYSSISYHIFKSKFFQALCSFAILLNNLGICIVELTIFKGSLKLIIDSYI
jgi:amino acid permease